MVTYRKVAEGEFASYRDGTETLYRIFNTSLGLSGHDTRNLYKVYLSGRPTQMQGTLQMCKKFVTARVEDAIARCFPSGVAQ